MFFFRREFGVSEGSKVEIQKQKHISDEEKKTPSVKGLREVHRTRAERFRDYLPKKA